MKTFDTPLLYGEVEMKHAWSAEEVAATVDSYFQMLKLELAGEDYSKASFRHDLLKIVSNRTEKAIGRKHSKISAILDLNGFPYIQGYKPQYNYQKILDQVVTAKAIAAGIPKSVTFPIVERSWEALSPIVLIKNMDKSSFLHHGTGIPKELTQFVNFTPTSPKRTITILHQGKTFSAALSPDPRQARVRLLWNDDFQKAIQALFPEIHVAFENDRMVSTPPQMRFEINVESDTYKVDLISPDKACEPPPYIPEDEEIKARMEGADTNSTTTSRMRNQKNRLDCIRYHGWSCKICGFNFEKFYGDAGKNFIEVHHIDPLHKAGESLVDPIKDMIPVCSNCHRIIHRSPDTTFPILTKKISFKDISD